MPALLPAHLKTAPASATTKILKRACKANAQRYDRP